MTGGDRVRENVTGFWNTVAPDYEAHPGNTVPPGSPQYAAWVACLGERLTAPPADVLDIATGTGFVALIAAGLGHRVTGIDLAPAMLDVARATAAARRLPVVWRLDDAVSPSFPPGSFDVIACRHLLWTLRQPVAALSAWRTLLRPGGRVIAFDGLWFAAEAEADDAPGDEPGLFERYYTPETREALPGMSVGRAEDFVEMFRAAGFGHATLEHLPALRDPSGGDAIPFVITALVAD